MECNIDHCRNTGWLVRMIVCTTLITIGYLSSNGYLSSDARRIMVIGKKGDEAGMFQSPFHLAIDGNGNIVVADALDGRVQTFDSKGNYIAGFRLNNSSNVVTKGMAVDGAGHIYMLAGIFTNYIFVYDEYGKYICQMDGTQNFYDVALGGADKNMLYALTELGVTRFANDGSVLKIPVAGGVDFPIRSICGRSGKPLYNKFVRRGCQIFLHRGIYCPIQ